MFHSKALQSAKIIAVAQISEELFEDRPVTVAAVSAELTFEVALEIVLNAVVIEQSVIDVNKNTIGSISAMRYFTPRDTASRSRFRLHIH